MFPIKLILDCTSDEKLNCIIFGQVSVEPREDGVRIDAVIQVGHQIPENQSLFPSSVSSHPQPSIPQIIVDEENITLLKAENKARFFSPIFLGPSLKIYLRQFISVWHFGVGQNGNHSGSVVDRLRGRNRVNQSLFFQKIVFVGVESNQVLEGIKLPSSNVKVSANGRHPEVIDSGFSEIGQDVRSGFPVGFPDQIGTILVGASQPFFGLETR